MKKVILVFISIFFNFYLAQASLSSSDQIDVFKAKPEVKKKLSTEELSEGLTFRDLYRPETNIDQKWAILKTLRKAPPEFSRKVYLSCIQDSDWVLRSGGLQFLSSLDPTLARTKAMELVQNDPALVVRSAALGVLDKLGIKNEKEILWKLFEDKKNFHRGQSLWIRKNLALILYGVSDSSENMYWAKLLNDKDAVIKATAVKALEKNSGYQLGKLDDTLEEKAKLWKEKFTL